ncbi:MAG: hypothetical protein WC382_11645 [Methanoregulaceae archaeon]|jgi:hypothetical protein
MSKKLINYKLLLILLLCIFSMIAAGCIERSIHKSEITLVKIDPFGNIQWQTVIQNPAYSRSIYQFMNTMIVTEGGGVLIAGTYFNSTSAHKNLRIIKIGPDGSVVWDRSESVVSGDILGTVDRLSDGYLVISRDGVVYSLNTDGLVEWTRDISNQVNGERSAGIVLTAMASTAPETIVVAGNGGTSSGDLILFELTPECVIMWQTIVQLRKGVGIIHSLIQTNGTQYLIGGSIYYPPDFPHTAEAWLTLINREGSISWEKTFGPCPGEVLSLNKTPKGKYDIVYHTTKSSPLCNAEQNLLIEAVVDTGGAVMDEFVIISPSDLTRETGKIFIIPCSPSRTTGHEYVITRFVSDESIHPGITLDVVTVGRLCNIGTNTSVRWASGEGEDISPEIDTIVRAADGGIAILGKTYYY